MFSSIKTKMLLLVVAIMITTAAALIFFTRGHIGKSMLEAEEKSVSNVIFLVKLNVENEYKNLLFYKMSMLLQRKNEMKNIASIALLTVERLYQLHRQGQLEEAEAKQLALDWIRALQYGKDSLFFAYDDRCIVLSHPNPAVVGKDMSGIADIKGTPLFRSMRQTVMRDNDGFAAFSWDDYSKDKDSRKLGYFVYHQGWDWVIATSVSIEDVEAEAQKKLDQIIRQLKGTFEKIKIAQSGYLFLFNGKREVLIHPAPSTESLLHDVNPATGRLILDDLMTASENPDKPVTYLWKDSAVENESTPHESYVTYFKTLDWYIASNARTEEVQMPARELVLRQSLFITIIFVAGMLVTYLLVSRISRHLNTLTDYAKDLPARDFGLTESRSSGIEQLPAQYGDEVGKLAAAFLFMEGSLGQYIKDLRETTAAKERIESELQIARDIQMSILPKIFPPFPERWEFDVYATVKPAREVGGDFYDFFFLDEEHLFFAIGDVSGKGVPASLFMAVTKTLLRASMRSERTLEDVMADVNHKLCEGNDACMFVTVFCGTLDVKRGEVTYVDAGHNPPIHITRKEDLIFVDLPRNMALGILENVEYQTGKLTLQPNDTLFMYTDGITEAMDVDQEFFSEERLKRSLHLMKGQTIVELTEGILDEVHAFAQNAPQADDITMLVLEYCGSGAPRESS